MAQDLQERIRQLEGKVATLTVINGALQNENETLRHDQASDGRPQAATDAELHELQEEFTRRIATADRTIAGLKEKNETLRAAVEAASKGGNANEARLQDQQAYLATLQAEGEAMSRKNTELEGTMRKLRSQMRKLESERDRLAGRHTNLEASLAGEQERVMHATQAAAMQIEIMEEKVRAAKQEAASQVAAARKEAAAAQEDARREAQRHCASTMASAIEREAALSANLADLRAEYEAASASFFTREEGLRQEVSGLEDCIRALEDEKTELFASSSDHSRPLMRQIESMAASAAAQQSAHAEAELQLIEHLKVVDAALSEARESEQSLRGKLSQTERALAAARAGLEGAAAQASELTEELGAERKRAGALTNDVKSAEEGLHAARRREEAAKQKAEADVQLLQQRLKAAESKVSMLDADRLNWQERYQESLKRSTPASPAHSLPISRAATHGTPQTSPFNSRPGGSDRAQSMVAAGQAEPTDDLDKLIREASAGSLHARQHPNANGHDPEASQLQYLQRRLSAAEADAEGARVELLRACQQAEAAAADVARCRALEQRLQELQKRYEMALELLGERNEHVDKLEDDIREMKDIFHSQLSLMADQLSMAKNAEQQKSSVADQPSNAMQTACAQQQTLF